MSASVALFAVLRRVEALALVLLGHAEADRLVDELQDDERHRDRVRAGRGAERRRLLAMEPLDDEPAERAARRAEVRRHERERRERTGRERAARVEAEPAEPQDARAGQRHREVVRQRPLLRILEALAED